MRLATAMALIAPACVAAATGVATPASAQGWCAAGARVGAASYGHWYRATVIGPDGSGKCRVHFDRFSAGSEEAVTREWIGPIALADQYDRPAGGGAAPVATRGGGGSAGAPRLVATSYTCTSFVGSVTGGGHMIPMPGITILPGGRYRHANGGGGTITAAGGTVEFHGGPLDRQAATYDAGPDGRRGNLHLFNERRSRTVIDCDGHG